MVPLSAQSADLSFLERGNENFLAPCVTIIRGNEMPIVKFVDALKSGELLLEQRKFEQVARVLTLALARSQDQQAWQKTQQLLERIPPRARVETLEIAFLYAKALMFNDELQKLLEFNTQTLRHHEIADAARIQLECAKSLLALRHYLKAREMLETVLPHVQGEFLGIAWSKLGLVLFSLGLPWQEVFQNAYHYLSGVELGYVLFNEGHCLDQSSRSREARATLLKALTFLKSDLKMLALIRYNLGISALRDLEPEAEHHFLEAQRLSKNPKNATVRASVLNGLAASRRV